LKKRWETGIKKDQNKEMVLKIKNSKFKIQNSKANHLTHIYKACFKGANTQYIFFFGILWFSILSNRVKKRYFLTMSLFNMIQYVVSTMFHNMFYYYGFHVCDGVCVNMCLLQGGPYFKGQFYLLSFTDRFQCN